MKKMRFIGLFIIVFMLVAVISGVVNGAESKLQSSQVSIELDGKKIKTDAEPYIDMNGRTQVPVRFIAEKLGCQVLWEENGKKDTVTIKKDKDVIELKIGENKALVNGQVKQLDTAATVKDGRTFVPIRFVSEVLGVGITWDSEKNTVRISTSSNNNAKPSLNKGSKDPQVSITDILPANANFVAPEIIGSPTDKSVIINVIPAKKIEFYIEYGTVSANYTEQTTLRSAEPSIPIESIIENLHSNARYYYRIRYRQPGESTFSSCQENSFVTQREPGNSFTFDIQGDSHPERRQQFDPELYLRTMQNVRTDKPDFYLTIGDDFSVDTMQTITKSAVEQLYINQRKFLGLIGSSAPLFLVNGNHEQAAKYVLDGTPNNAAVWGQNARNSFFSQPAPNNFYTGNAQTVESIGQLRDYYAWTWGDALFVTIDPYWHSEVPVDNALRGGEKRSDMWDITLGDEQYQWFKKTLEESNAKYKFVFTHHVLGTGRGGTDLADIYEWGGKSKNGVWEFNQKRPGWELPIHQLMAKNGVTIFFQGHDHIFVKQELDGVIYQTLPEPADPNYMLYNADAYKSDVKLPNSGHVRVTVSPTQVKVDYIRSLLPKDEINGKANGEVVYSYSVLPK